MSLAKTFDEIKYFLGSMAKKITCGEKRREAAAEIAIYYGTGGQTFAANEFRMGRNTVRKGIHEIESGTKVEDKFKLRGRKKATEKLPFLEKQIRVILDSQSQADPKFQTNRLYTKLTVGEIRKQLIKQYGYASDDLPQIRTLNNLVNEMKYTMRTVKKTEPIKKVEETNEIFAVIQGLSAAAAADDNIVQLSVDAKATVNIGNFSRGGKSRVEVKAYDHDFGDKSITPFGIMDVKKNTTDIYLCESKVTADCIADRIEDYWISYGYSGAGKTLLLNADNGPENSSRRTEFIKRMVQFSIDNNTPVILAYYPPYHSKYNRIERVWGALEKHWDAALLDTEETVKKYVETATYANKHLKATIIDKVYKTGIKLNKKTMEIYENAIERSPGLENWFVYISPQKCIQALAFTDCTY